MITLTADENAALDILSTLPAPPPYVVDELGRIDEAASDVPRRIALAEIAELKHKARCLSSAVADVVDAAARGATLREYSAREVFVIADAFESAGLDRALASEAVATRLRAVEIQTLMRADRAQHAAE